MSNLKKYRSNEFTSDPRPDWMRDFHESNKHQTPQFKGSITIDIDKQLLYDSLTGKGDVAKRLLDAISREIPFMLYQDTIRFAVVIPKIKTVVTFYPNDCTIEVLDEKQFQNRIKMLYVTYPNFEYPTIKMLQNIFSAIMKEFRPCLRNTTY